MSSNLTVDTFSTLTGVHSSVNNIWENTKRLYSEVGLDLIGTFEEGCTVTNPSQVVLHAETGKGYSWGGSFNKIVPKPSTPATSGGIGAGAWVDRTDNRLRSDLNVIVKVFESVVDMVADASLIVGQKCRTLGYYVVGDGGGNDYDIVAAATGTDDGGSYIDLFGSGLQAKGLFLDGVVSTVRFGDYEDYSRTAEAGTNCAIYIQSAINYCYDNGVGELHKYGDSLYTQIIIVPSGLSIIGRGKEKSGMFRDKSDLSGRGIIVGTYGPRNSIHPGLETPYSITASVIGNDYVDVSVSDSANFSAGDLVYIQGTGVIAGDTTIMTPNHGGKVTGVNHSTGRIYLDFVVDDNYAPGAGGEIRKMNTGDPANTIADQTGREWGLFVAVNSSIKSMTLSNAPTATWPIINLSTYECVFDDIHYDGNQPFSGNPVVKTEFKNSTGGYGNRVYEFAYISHDNLISDCRFVRLYDATPFSSFAYTMWDNNTEGGKRTTIRGVYVDDFDPTVQTLYLAYLYKSTIDDCVLKSSGSCVRNTEGTTKDSTIYWSFKTGFSGYAHGIRLGGKDEAINNKIISVSPSSGNGILVRAADDVTAVGNHLLSYDGTQTIYDTIKLDWTAGTPRAEISANKTYLSGSEFCVFKRESTTATPSTSAVTLPSYGTWLVTVWSNLSDRNHSTTGTFLVNYLDASLDILSTQQIGSSRVSAGDTFGLTGVTLSNPSSSGVLTAGITWINGMSYEPNFMFSAKLLSSISNSGLA